MSTTKIDQKSSKIENHQKQQNWENWKSVKIDKMQKLKKWKKSKTQKHKSEKWKNTKTPKWSKCHLNGQNRQFVFSEPPGPGVFQFQGVPRDRFLRPKSTPSLLNGNSQIDFHLFLILANLLFHHFCVLCILPFCWFWWFVTFSPLYVIRPYGNIGGDMIYVWWFSPHCYFILWSWRFFCC